MQLYQEQYALRSLCRCSLLRWIVKHYKQKKLVIKHKPRGCTSRLSLYLQKVNTSKTCQTMQQKYHSRAGAWTRADFRCRRSALSQQQQQQQQQQLANKRNAQMPPNDRRTTGVEVGAVDCVVGRAINANAVRCDVMPHSDPCPLPIIHNTSSANAHATQTKRRARTGERARFAGKRAVARLGARQAARRRRLRRRIDCHCVRFAQNNQIKFQTSIDDVGRKQTRSCWFPARPLFVCLFFC